ncbi:MAG: ribosome biogenesis factor YjgA [Natronospirillum sp.]
MKNKSADHNSAASADDETPENHTVADDILDPYALPVDDEVIIVSKEEMKREMTRLLALAETMVKLSSSRLAALGLSDHLHRAILDCHRISKPDARNRHLRHLARLLQNLDVERLQHEVDLQDGSSDLSQQLIQRTERWRDVLTTEPDKLAEFFDQHPQADRQHLGQLVRNAHKAWRQHTVDSPEPNAAEPKVLQQRKRKLFQAIREQLG